MGDERNPLTPPRRLRLVLALVATLIVGLVLGVVADRVYLWATHRTPDPRLMGEWVTLAGAGNEENIIRFHPDGTYDSVLMGNVDGKRTQVWHISHQYRWVNRETIEMYDTFNGWTTHTLVFEGDRLNLLYSGTVWRLTRKGGK